MQQIEAKPEVESQDLSSYLIRPIQRLPRYEMLLRVLCPSPLHYLRVSLLTLYLCDVVYAGHGQIHHRGDGTSEAEPTLGVCEKGE
jgi:hypothetical protein